MSSYENETNTQKSGTWAAFQSTSLFFLCLMIILLAVRSSSTPDIVGFLGFLFGAVCIFGNTKISIERGWPKPALYLQAISYVGFAGLGIFVSYLLWTTPGY